MSTPCLLIELSKFSLKSYPTANIKEVNIIVCNCAKNRDLNVIDSHDAFLLTLECSKRDFMALLKKLDVQLKILAPKKAEKPVDLKESPFYKHFSSIFIKHSSDLLQGKWGCISMGFGLANFCFCGNEEAGKHGLLI